jgi:hypothetical protein
LEKAEMDAAGITINSSSAKVIDNYRFEFTVPEGYSLKDNDVCLTQAVITNSSFNLSASGFNNTSFGYSYPDGAGAVTFQINLQDGCYGVDLLTEAIHSQMFANKTYLIDSDANPVFFLRANVSAVFWGIALTCDPVPDVLPAGWSLPAGAPALPTVASTPQLIISPANNFGQLLGYEPGSFPPVPQSSQYLAISVEEPQVTPQYAFSVSLSCVNLPTVNPSSPGSIYPFTFTVPYQVQQNLEPKIWRWFPCVDGRYTKIVLSILDQDGRPAKLASKFSQFSLAFRDRKR